MANILRVHYDADVNGGAGYEVSKVNSVVNEFASVKSHLIYLYRNEGHYSYQSTPEAAPTHFSSIAELKTFLKARIENLGVDLIHLHSMPFAEITRLLIGFNLPVVRTSHEPMLTCPGWSRFHNNSNQPCERDFGLGCTVKAFTERCQRSRNPLRMLDAYRNVKAEIEEFFPRYRRLVVNSRYLAKTLTDHGADPAKVVVAPSPQFGVTHAPIRQTGASVDTIPVIFAGRVSQPKGIFRLIDAYELLQSRSQPKTRLEIVGEGGGLEQSKKVVNKKSLKNVTFHGWVARDSLKEMFSQDCIAVIPSIYPDHFPNVVAEAMLAGATVVASDAGGTSEWFEHGKSGLSYPYNDTDGLAGTIEKLLNDEDLRQRLAVAGRQEILTKHSPEACGAFYHQLYGEVLSEEAHRAK